MDKRRLLILTRNFTNSNLRNFNHCYFFRFRYSNYSKRTFCKFLREEINGKTTNLHIQKQQFNLFSSSFPFRILQKTLNNDFDMKKHRAKIDFSILRQSKEKKNKSVTLGIKMLNFSLESQQNLLEIRIIRDKNGNKWIHLCQKIPFDNYHFPANISVPKDAYLWIKAMDSLMRKLASSEDNHPICQICIMGGLYYNYKLEIGPNKKYGQLQFTMIPIERQKQLMALPIRSLPLFRDQMAKLLAEFDGTQQIGPPPSALPKWIMEETGKNVEQQHGIELYRDTFYYKVDDKPQDRKIQIEYCQGESGKEYIRIVQAFDIRLVDENVKKLLFNFAHIPIEDAPPLLDTMQAMSNDLQKQMPIDQNQSSIICQQSLKGIDFDYKLELNSCPNKQMNFGMQTFSRGKHVPTKLNDPVPIDVFHWLQQQMADILMISSSHKLGQSQDAVSKQGTEPELIRENFERAEKIDLHTKNRRVDVIELHTENLEYMDYDQETKILQIILSHKNRRKWIFLLTRLSFTDHKFVRIYVPEDAYKFVKAMDELLRKIVENEKPPNSPIFVRVCGGLLYDFKLGIRPNQNQNSLLELEFTLESITTAAFPKHKPKELHAPIRLLPLLREQMVKMLAEFDGTQQIEPPLSTIPKWISREDDSSPNALTTTKERNKGKWETIRQETLDYSANIFNEKHDRQITIELQRNKRGVEFIQFVQKFNKLDSSKDIGEDNKKFINFPSIPMPADANRLFDAMDNLYNVLQEKYLNLQIPNDIPLGTIICHQLIKGGLFYDYKLQIIKSHVSKELEFKLETIATEANKWHKSSKLYGPIPMNVFHWLKEQMAELLKSSQKQTCLTEGSLEFNNVYGKGQTAYKGKANKLFRGLIRRETEEYRVDIESRDRQINVDFSQDKSGQKFIRIAQIYHIRRDGHHFIQFPNIPVPEDAYRLIDAMRALFNELQEKRTSVLLIGPNQSSMICQQLVKGINYDYKLEIHSSQNQQFDFRLQTMPNEVDKMHKPKQLLGPIPIDIFIWLMETMTEILADYDESNRNEENIK